MDQIIPHLFIARMDEREKWKGTVINVSREDIKDENVSNLPLEPSNPDREIFLEAVESAVKEVERGKDVTLVCRQGVSRSVSVGVGVLMETESLTLREALRWIELEHPESNPSNKMLDLLKNIYGSREPASR